MKRITQLVQEIATLQNKATSKQQAIEMGLESYYGVDHNSIYGGYRIDDIKVDSGACFGTFNESSMIGRRSLKEMTNFLEGILYGLSYKK